MLFQLSKQAALLQLQIEALERRVDRFVLLYGNVDQAGLSSDKGALWQNRRESASQVAYFSHVRIRFVEPIRLGIVCESLA